MNKAFEKILKRLDSHIEDAKSEGDFSYIKPFEIAKIAVREAAEEYNDGWIPCSERLPECGTKVLVQYGCGRINIEECKKNTDGIIGFYDGNYWSNADNYISWQPLPEPFKERD